MAVQPQMVWDNLGTPQAHRLIAGTALESSQLGGPTGFTAATRNVTHGRMANNRQVEFLGVPYLMHRGTVYAFNEGTSLWDSVFTLTNPSTSDDQAISGLHVLEIGGELVLCGYAHQNVSTNARGFWTTDGLVWNETANIAVGAQVWPYYSMTAKRRLWACTGNASTIHVYNWIPGQNQIQTFDLGLGNGGENGFLINFNGRMIHIGTPRTSNDRQPIFMQELVGPGFVPLNVSGGANPGLVSTLFASPDGALGLFQWTDGNLYAVFWEHTDPFPDTDLGQMRVVQFVPSGSAPGSSFAENDVTSAVVPSDWLTGGAFDGLGSLTTQTLVHVDTENPTSPTVHWTRISDVTTLDAGTWWTFNGPGALATVEATAITRDFAVPQGANVSGKRSYTDGDADCSLFNLQQPDESIRFDFVYHAPIDATSPGLINAKLYYSLGGSDWMEATLDTGIAPTVVSGGDPVPTIGSNTINGITAGSTTFRVAWDRVADLGTAPAIDFELKLAAV